MLDAEKLNDNRREKSCFVRSLETMSAKDIAEPAEGRKKKRLTAAFVTRLAAFLVCFGVFGVSLYMIVERVIDDIQTNRLIEDLQTAAVERAVPRMTVMPSSSHFQGTFGVSAAGAAGTVSVFLGRREPRRYFFPLVSPQCSCTVDSVESAIGFPPS